mmetsp:Transcript_1912/g.6856  ORF Transcript_1912/g.6856 Transcript_1912/m.6856 type:complete len:150 (-) Transcript_1912:2404-2853(-)
MSRVLVRLVGSSVSIEGPPKTVQSIKASCEAQPELGLTFEGQLQPAYTSGYMLANAVSDARCNPRTTLDKVGQLIQADQGWEELRGAERGHLRVFARRGAATSALSAEAREQLRDAQAEAVRRQVARGDAAMLPRPKAPLRPYLNKAHR